MAAGTKRLTFIITPDIEAPLASIKKEFFYNHTQSEMICELISAGLRAVKEEKATKEKRLEQEA